MIQQLSASAGKANHYYFGPDESGTRAGHLERNLSAALRASGGYVWFWGEKYSWIKYDPEQAMGWRLRQGLPRQGQMVFTHFRPSQRILCR